MTKALPKSLRRFVVDAATGCWLWTGPLADNGYPWMVVLHGKKHFPHRAIYELLVGPVDHSLQVHHKCLNRSCVNPAHMRPLTIPEHRKVHGPITKARRDEYAATVWAEWEKAGLLGPSTTT